MVDIVKANDAMVDIVKNKGCNGWCWLVPRLAACPLRQKYTQWLAKRSDTAVPLSSFLCFNHAFFFRLFLVISPISCYSNHSSLFQPFLVIPTIPCYCNHSLLISNHSLLMSTIPCSSWGNSRPPVTLPFFLNASRDRPDEAEREELVHERVELGLWQWKRVLRVDDQGLTQTSK